MILSDNILILINVLAAVVVFVHCVCRLSVRRWPLKSPELWAHAVLCGGAVGVIGHGLVQGGWVHPSEIVINCGMAVYFLSQSWRLWIVRRRIG